MRAKTSSLWLVLFVIFLNWLGVGLVYPMFSSMLFHETSTLVDVGTSLLVRGWYLGILLAAMSIGQFFSGPVMGTLSDQKGRRPLLIYTLLISIFGYALGALGVLTNSLITLIVSRVIVGLGAGNSAVVNATIADISTPENKAKNFGLLSMAQGVGFTIGPFLGGYFSTSNYSIPFLIAGIALIVNLALLLFAFKETHLTPKNATIRWDVGIQHLKKSFKIPHLRVIFLTILCLYFGWSFFYEFIPVTWIQLYHSTPDKIGLYYAFGAGVYALSAGLLIRPIVSKFKHISLLFYTLLILSLGLFLLLLQPPAGWIWVYLALINFLGALLFPTSTAMVSDFAKKEDQGEIMGVLTSIISASFALSPLFAGFILGSNAQMPIILGGSTFLLGTLFLGYSFKKEIFTRR